LPATGSNRLVDHQISHRTSNQTGLLVGVADGPVPSLLIGVPDLSIGLVKLAIARHEQIDDRDATDSPECIAPIDEMNVVASYSNVAGPEVTVDKS